MVKPRILSSIAFLLLFGVVMLTGCDRQAQVQKLVNKLNDPVMDERSKAVVALGEIGEDAASAVPALEKRLGDKEWIVRNKAVYALQRIGTADAENALKRALPSYLSALKSSDLELRLIAAEGLGFYGKYGVSALPELRKAFQENVMAAASFTGKDSEREQHYTWISNAIMYSIQKIQPHEKKQLGQ